MCVLRKFLPVFTRVDARGDERRSAARCNGTHRGESLWRGNSLLFERTHRAQEKRHSRNGIASRARRKLKLTCRYSDNSTNVNKRDEISQFPEKTNARLCNVNSKLEEKKKIKSRVVIWLDAVIINWASSVLVARRKFYFCYFFMTAIGNPLCNRFVRSVFRLFTRLLIYSFHLERARINKLYFFPWHVQWVTTHGRFVQFFLSFSFPRAIKIMRPKQVGVFEESYTV